MESVLKVYLDGKEEEEQRVYEMVKKAQEGKLLNITVYNTLTSAPEEYVCIKLFENVNELVS